MRWWWIGTVAAIAILAIAFFALPPLLRSGSVENRRSSPDPASAPADADGAPASPSPAHLRGTPQPPSELVPTPGLAPEEGPTRPVLLRGSVSVAGSEGETHFDPPLEFSVGPPVRFTASVVVTPAQASLKASGPFAFDLRTVLEGMVENQDAPELWLRIDHPGYVPIQLPLPIASPAAILAGQAGMEDVDAVLQPASTVAGVVVAAEGEPAGGARVALHPFPGEEPESIPIATVATDAFGVFRLRVAEKGRLLIVATWTPERSNASHPGRLGPASAIVDVSAARPVTHMRLTLGFPHVVRGTVRHEESPLEGAQLSCRLQEGGTHLTTSQVLPGPGLCWTGHSVQWAGGDAVTKEDGTFEIRGLAPLRHELRVVSAPTFHAHTKTTGSSVRSVVPPQDGIEIDLRLARLEIHVRANGLLDSVRVRVTDTGMAPEFGEAADDVAWGTSWLDLDEEGRTSVLVSPGCDYVITVESEPGADVSYESFWAHFTAPVAGEVRTFEVELEPMGPKPGLVVMFEGDGAEHVVVAGFGFWEPEIPVRDQSPHPVCPRVARAADGSFHLEDLAPGRWRLHVRPGRAWHETPGDWAEVVVDVEVPEVGAPRLLLPIHEGGRLYLHVTDADERYLEAACTIHDPAGEEVEAHFRGQASEGGLHVVHLSVRTLNPVSPNWVEPVLAPGTYRLTLELEGYAREEREVEVRAGATSTVRVVLRRTP